MTAFGRQTTSVCNQPPRPTQPPTLCGTGNLSTGQSAVMLCGWGMKARWLISYVDKRVGGQSYPSSTRANLSALKMSIAIHTVDGDTHTQCCAKCPVLFTYSRSKSLTTPTLSRHRSLVLIIRNAHCGQRTFRLAWCHEHSAATVTELLQPQDPACGTLFQSNYAIRTSPTECSDDS